MIVEKKETSVRLKCSCDVLIDKPEIFNKFVEDITALVNIKPVEKQSNGTTAEKIAQFRKKHNRETFVAHLKEQVAKGRTFEFDVQKVINGTETEEEEQARYRQEKQVWGKTVANKTGECN